MRRRSLAILIVTLVWVAVSSQLAVARETKPSPIRRVHSGRQVEVRAGKSLRKPAPILASGTKSLSSDQVQALLGPATADIQVTYTGFTAPAQMAFEAAVQIWETKVVSTQVIHVNATWEALGSGILGSAGPSNIFLMNDNYVYPAALAEALCSCEAPGEPYEIDASFSSAFSNWYFGTDGNAPANTYDLMTVVMHELGHGLGFLSSFGVGAGNKGYWGFSADSGAHLYPLRYDVWEYGVATGGSPFTTTYPDGWTGYTALKTELTDTTVYFGGPNVVAALGGRAKLYAPATWSSGSSNSHFDESTFPTGTLNALMTPQLAGGEVIHDPGPLTLALFRDIGWQTSSSAPVKPTVSLNLPTTTNSATVAVSMSESDPAGTGIAGWYLSSSPIDPGAGDAGWLAVEPTTFTLSGADGNKTVYAWVKNNAGTVSDASSDTTLLDRTAPTVGAPRADFVAGQTIGTTVLVRVSWPTATDTSGVGAYQLQFKRNSGAWTPISLGSPTQTSVDIALTHGNNYTFRVAATDTLGNTSAFATSTIRKLVRKQENAAAVSYSGSWKRVALGGSSGGYVKRSLTSGNTATFTFTGNSAAFVAARGANRGISEIRVDGALVATIDLYSAALETRRVIWTSAGLGAGTHTVQVRVTGSNNPAATGIRLDVDAFFAWQ
jgi:hypothetical protein